MIFRASLFVKRPYNILLLTFIMFKYVKIGKRIDCMRQKLSKNMLIVKFHPGMKCLHVFLSVTHPGMKFHPCLFDRDEFNLG